MSRLLSLSEVLDPVPHDNMDAETAEPGHDGAAFAETARFLDEPGEEPW